MINLRVFFSDSTTQKSVTELQSGKKTDYLLLKVICMFFNIPNESMLLLFRNKRNETVTWKCNCFIHLIPLLVYIDDPDPSICIPK